MSLADILSKAGDALASGSSQSYIDQKRQNRQRQDNLATQNRGAYAEERLKGFTPHFDETGRFNNYTDNPDTQANDLKTLSRLSPGIVDALQNKQTIPATPATPTSGMSQNQGGQNVSFMPGGQEIPAVSSPTAPAAAAPTQAAQPQQLPRILKSPQERAAEIQASTKANIPGAAPKQETSPSSTPIPDQGTPESQFQSRSAQRIAAAQAKGQRVEFADKTVIGGGQGLDITGEVAKPGTPEVETRDNFVPRPDVLQQLLGGSIKSQFAKTADPEVDMASLPPIVRQKLQLPESGKIKASILKQMMAKMLGDPKASGSSISPGVEPIIGGIASGKLDIGTGLNLINRATQGNPSKADIEMAKTAFTQSGANSRQVRGQEETNQRATRNVISQSNKEFHRTFFPAVEQLGFAVRVKAMANSKDTTGVKTILNTMLLRASGQASNSISDTDMRSFGLEGWSARANQAISAIEGEGLTPTTKKYVNRVADEFLKVGAQALLAKSGFMIRGLKADLLERGMDEAKIDKLVARAYSPEQLVKESMSKEGASNAAAVLSGGSGSPAEQRRALLQKFTQATSELDKDTYLNASQKRDIKKQMTEKYQEKIRSLGDGK